MKKKVHSIIAHLAFLVPMIHPCLTDPREVRNLRGEGPPQDHFAWGELEGDICVGIAWGLRGDGSVAKVVCSERGYGKMCGD